MTGWAQTIVLFGVLGVSIGPLGHYMSRVFDGQNTLLTPIFGPIERSCYALLGISPNDEMNWPSYARAVALLSLVCLAGLFGILMLQGQAVEPLLALNIAISFVTNTNWQSYVPETTLSPFVQMGGLAVQNFISPAVGLAVLTAIARGLTREKGAGLGNFWADVIRGILYILFPLALVLALALASQGVVQTFQSSVAAHGLQEQTIPLGPVASQVAIKQLGGNGGGFFNANGAHPFENPTPLSNFLQMLAILLIPMAQCVMFGRMTGDKRQGLILLAAMAALFIPLYLFGAAQESAPQPQLAHLGIDQASGNMEGKETRFGVPGSVLWTSASTATSNGSVNASLDSYTPLGGLVPLAFIQFGEVVFGGVGSGLYGMLIFVMIAVFVAGLMVGRTPEYLGKKLDAFDIKMCALAVLLPAMAVLIGTAFAVALEAGRSAVLNSGAQGFSEILYAFSSASHNNGSAFAGLSSNTPFYNLALGLAMIVGRFGVIVPVLALAGSMAAKTKVPASAGTLPTTSLPFLVILIAIIVTLGILTFVPALMLGPVAAHFSMPAVGAAP